MEGIGYWIFLAAMYLLSALFKKRQQQAPAESDSPSEKKSNPFEAEFLQDMFGDLKEMVGMDEEKEEDELEDYEYVVEEEAPEPAQVPEEHDHVGFDDPSLPKTEPTHKENRYSENHEEINKGIGPLFTHMDDLKRAIVMKEVLDKPRALRRGIR